MNCSTCASHLSDYLEKAVTPLLEREMRAHFDACRRCAADLRELEVALRRLRDVAVVATPQGLAASVTRRLLAASPDASHPPSPERSARRHALEKRSPWSWAPLAAASLLIAAGSFFMGHFVSQLDNSKTELLADTAAQLRDARNEVLNLENELRGTRAKLVEENSTLRREMVALKNGLEEWKVATLAGHASDLEEEREAQRRLEQRLQEATRLIGEQARAFATVEARLAATIEKKDALAQELTSAQAELSRGRRGPELQRRQVVAPASPPAFVSESRETSPVLFVREGDVLRLKLRGNLEEHVPQLLALAEDEAQPDIADLALATLETRLEPLAADEEANDIRSRQERSGVEDWFRRHVGGFVRAAAEEPEEPGVWTADRSARIDRYRRIYQQRFRSP